MSNGFKVSLEAARVNAGMTQEDVCKELHITKPTLSSWEKGKTEPSISQFRQLCSLYKCPEDCIRLS